MAAMKLKRYSQPEPEYGTAIVVFVVVTSVHVALFFGLYFLHQKPEPVTVDNMTFVDLGTPDGDDKPAAEGAPAPLDAGEPPPPPPPPPEEPKPEPPKPKPEPKPVEKPKIKAVEKDNAKADLRQPEKRKEPPKKPEPKP